MKQVGQKPGSVGLPLPGVAIRAVDESGRPMPADGEGRLEALVAGQSGWVDLDRRGRIDRDGFVILELPAIADPVRVRLGLLGLRGARGGGAGDGAAGVSSVSAGLAPLATAVVLVAAFFFVLAVVAGPGERWPWRLPGAS